MLRKHSFKYQNTFCIIVKNKERNANYIAEVLQQTLAGETAQLWDMLFVLTGILKCGMQIFHTQGPMCAGKSTAIRAFCLLCSLHCTRNILLVSTQNAPCNKFIADMWVASQHSNIHVSRVASQEEAGFLRSSKAAFAECVLGTSDKEERRFFE